MKHEATIASAWGLSLTVILAGLIIVGSRNLAHFDAALVAYTAAVLFATFGLTYRYAMWLQRPPTALYWRRGWQAFFKRGHLRRNVATGCAIQSTTSYSTALSLPATGCVGPPTC